MIGWRKKPRLPPRRVPASAEKWGTFELVEPQVRCLVAEHLGVGVEKLVSEVSLRDDLAADSLDLVELALALEVKFAIAVPEHVLDGVRSYRDLVQATALLIVARCDAEARAAEPPPHVKARLVPAGGEASGTLERTGWLTPYAAETIADDAVRAGAGSLLELSVAAGATGFLARMDQQFARVRARGVQVVIRNNHRPARAVPPSGTQSRVHAAP